MSKAKSNRTPINVLKPVQEGQANSVGFMANLRQALEHVCDAEWLKQHSPLESVRTVIESQPPRRASLPSIGIKALDEQILTIWADWEAREKSGLQSLLWAAVRHLQSQQLDKEVSYPALLLLTYFQDPRPKQGDLIKQLAVGQSTFYRQLGAAVEALVQAVVALMQPSLRLESPIPKPLIGRDPLLHDCLAALKTGGVISLIGASGLGKTSLGAALCQTWSASNRKCFWYTFRPGLTDNVQHLIFSLALFLHQHGASNLWLQLLAHAQQPVIDAGKALAMIRKSLEALTAAPPLFCFDEVDLLLPNELEDSIERQHLRAFLEAFVESSRNGAPVLFIGQRLLMEPERHHIFTLGRLDVDETRALLRQANIDVDPAQCAAAHSYTRGNPLLLQLFITLHHLGEPVLANVSHLSSAVSLDWFLVRLRRHLNEKEQELLDAVCVFDSPAPASLWRKQAKTLARLVHLSLMDRDADDQVALPMALRDALYRQQPAELRTALHVAAAQACAEQGAYTLAARHFVLGQQPEMAVWTWHTHRDAEVRQGQAHTAWGIFEPLRASLLADEQDRRALALVMADLAYLHGKTEDGLAALNATTWKAHSAATTRAHELRAKLLTRRGDVDGALAAFRAGLDDVSRLSAAKPIALRTEISYKLLLRVRDVAAARHEAALAKQDVEVLLGNIEDEAGNLDQALEHFGTALVLAQQSGDPVRLAKAHESLGIVEARRLNTDVAAQHFVEAGRYFRAFGDVVNAASVSMSNLAFAYLAARRYGEAVEPARQAVAFFQDMGMPYELSLNEANLAEAYVNLGEAEHAELHAMHALAQEETVVRPQCLYVLGHTRRLQCRYAEAERFCNEALNTAGENQDPWNRAYALRVLAEVYRDWGKLQEARTTFTRARDAFTQLGLRDDADRMNEQIAACEAMSISVA